MSKIFDWAIRYFTPPDSHVMKTEEEMAMKTYAKIACVILGLASLCFIGCSSTNSSTDDGGGGNGGDTPAAENIIRLYYIYPTTAGADIVKEKTYDSQNVGSAYSSDGVNFTQDAGIRLGPEANLTDPDVFKDSNGIWTMFYSKAVSSDPLESSVLYKATSTTPSGTFETMGGFAGIYGNISSTIEIGDVFYVYAVQNGSIEMSTYDSSDNQLTWVGQAILNAADPSVIQIADGSYIMFFKSESNTYEGTSPDGTSWTLGLNPIVANAEVPGAIYIGGTVYLYYVNSNTSEATSGLILVRTSADEGATFGEPQTVSGLQDAACDPDPVAYE